MLCFVAIEDNFNEQYYRGPPAELDYFDFVARATGADILEDAPPSKAKPAESDQHREVVETVKEELVSVPAARDKLPTLADEKEVVLEQKSVVSSLEHHWDNVEAQDIWDLFDVGAHITILFPDPFQAYVFSGLLVWLLSALVLLRREWKKSSRIVLEVYLQQGAGLSSSVNVDI